MSERARHWLQAGSHFSWVPREPLQHTDSLDIFHAEFGDREAPLLLMVHGFPTSSIDWQDVASELSGTHRVCVLDLPGFGFSDKPAGETYTLRRDSELLAYYVEEILGASTGAVIAHDRGDSVALAFTIRCAADEFAFEPTNLVLSNGNIFLPLSNLTDYQRQLLDPRTAPSLDFMTAEMFAAGLGLSMFAPPRAPDDPVIAALADTFAYNDGMAVMHGTIQYLVERAENERQWLDSLAALPVKTTLVWGLCDTVAPLRVAAHVWDNYLVNKPGANEFWVLPRANHYLQNDQPHEFVAVLEATLSDTPPIEPGPLSPAVGAPVFVDRSRAQLPLASEVFKLQQG